MSYESRAYDNEHGDPVVVLVVTGTHDVSRLANLLNGGSPNSEQVGVGRTLLRQVRRHNAGRAALRLLRDHGGPDFTADPADPEAVDIAERRAAADLHALARAADLLQQRQPSGCACPTSSLKACGWNEGVGAVADEIRRRARRTVRAVAEKAS
jgi:hypothetical protein